ncbi:GGDEF domain-containing protein [Streptomyces sp. NPDC002248]
MSQVDATALAAVVPVLGWATHSGYLIRSLATARRDPLTNLPTRAAFTARASRLLAKSPNTVVLLVDLDDFKAINDTYGHDAGDAVLTATAQRLALWAGPHGIAARLGGDEFAAAIPDLARTPGPRALGWALNQSVTHHGTRLPVGASAGFCHRHDLTTPDLSAALTHADAAMYAAKDRGRRGRRNTHN